MLTPDDFFDLKDFQHRALFSESEFVWEVLTRLNGYLKETLTPNVPDNGLPVLAKTCVLHKGQILTDGIDIIPGNTTKGELQVLADGELLSGASVLYAGVTLFNSDIFIGKGTVVEPGAFIRGPVIIGDNTEVRQGAYIRGNCLVGNRCVVGHTTEAKTAILLDDAKAGHFAYLGDSILGNSVNLGAGTKLANLKIIASEICINAGGKTYPTGLRKLGAILGDGVETGCNSVTSPGTLMGPKSVVYPCVHVPGGYYPPRSIVSHRTRKVLSVKTLKERG